VTPRSKNLPLRLLQLYSFGCPGKCAGCVAERPGGAGSRKSGQVKIFKLLVAIETRWPKVNAPHLVALVMQVRSSRMAKLI
jgi:hypothetical protein